MNFESTLPSWWDGALCPVPKNSPISVFPGLDAHSVDCLTHFHFWTLAGLPSPYVSWQPVKSKRRLTQA